MFDPSFEDTSQVIPLVDQAVDPAGATGSVSINFGSVIAGQNYLIERIVLHIESGAAPTGDERFNLYANVASPIALRSGLIISSSYFDSLNLAEVDNDLASPIRFWSNERIIVVVSGMQLGGADNLVVVTMQARVVQPKEVGANAGELSAELVPFEPVNTPPPTAWS